MIKLIVGLIGTGKTKTLIEMANAALEKTNGSVICLEKGDKLKFDVKYQIRLIDTDEYSVTDAQTLYGFAAGILASNHDITDLFIDSALKICGDDVDAFEKMMLAIDALCEKANVNVVITSSIEAEKVPASLAKFL